MYSGDEIYDDEVTSGLDPERERPRPFNFEGEGRKALITTPPCPMCKQTVQLEVTLDEYRAYRSGAHVQDAFPHMSSDNRERLITGVCGDCWTKLFADDEDEDDE